jgi:hypothetical protein
MGSVMTQLLAKCGQIPIQSIRRDLVGRPYSELWEILVKEEGLLPVALLSAEVVDQDAESVDRCYVDSLHYYLSHALYLDS